MIVLLSDGMRSRNRQSKSSRLKAFAQSGIYIDFNMFESGGKEVNIAGNISFSDWMSRVEKQMLNILYWLTLLSCAIQNNSITAPTATFMEIYRNKIGRKYCDARRKADVKQLRSADDNRYFYSTCLMCTNRHQFSAHIRLHQIVQCVVYTQAIACFFLSNYTRLLLFTQMRRAKSVMKQNTFLYNKQLAREVRPALSSLQLIAVFFSS